VQLEGRKKRDEEASKALVDEVASNIDKAMDALQRQIQVADAMAGTIVDNDDASELKQSPPL
jgi:hypothetical protein